MAHLLVPQYGQNRNVSASSREHFEQRAPLNSSNVMTRRTSSRVVRPAFVQVERVLLHRAHSFAARHDANLVWASVGTNHRSHFLIENNYFRHIDAASVAGIIARRAFPRDVHHLFRIFPARGHQMRNVLGRCGDLVPAGTKLANQALGHNGSHRGCDQRSGNLQIDQARDGCNAVISMYGR